MCCCKPVDMWATRSVVHISTGNRDVAKKAAKTLLELQGRHGADPNLGEFLDAMPHTVPEHECRGSIPPKGLLVHA
jgi:hypothetical protein